MKLKHITFTGIDAKTDIQELMQIQQEYPIAEFGVLTSYHWNENGNRYLNPAFMSNLYAGSGRLKLALHICGRAAHDAAVGEWKKIEEHLHRTIGLFGRIQLNISGRTDNPDYVHWAAYDDQEVIIQQKDVEHLSLYNKTWLMNHHLKKFSVLLDASGGQGIDTPIRVLPTKEKVGYAGGFNPENAADKLRYLLTHQDVHDFWIDMESGVRTDDWLDLDKVRKVLEQCHEVIYDVYGRPIAKEELERHYDNWDYPYKPSREMFLRIAMSANAIDYDVVENIERVRIDAYYSHGGDTAFQILSCLLYYAVIDHIKTPYDHVLLSDKDFEYKLNHLDEKK